MATSQSASEKQLAARSIQALAMLHSSAGSESVFMEPKPCFQVLLLGKNRRRKVHQVMTCDDCYVAKLIKCHHAGQLFPLIEPWVAGKKEVNAGRPHQLQCLLCRWVFLHDHLNISNIYTHLPVHRLQLRIARSAHLIHLHPSSCRARLLTYLPTCPD